MTKEDNTEETIKGIHGSIAQKKQKYIVQNTTTVTQHIGDIRFSPLEKKLLSKEEANLVLRFPGFQLLCDPEVLMRETPFIKSKHTHSIARIPVCMTNFGFDGLREVRRIFWPEPAIPNELRDITESAFPRYNVQKIEPASKTRDIGFVVMSLFPPDGGLRAVGHIAYYLAKRHHNVHIINLNLSALQEKAIFDGLPIQCHLGFDDVGKLDYIIGTYWATYPIIEQANIQARHKIGFIQGNEPAWPHFSKAEQNAAKNAFSIPGWKYIVVASHLAKTCREEYNTNVVGTLPGSGVDMFEFSQRTDKQQLNNRVCFINRNLWWKGTPIVLEAIELIKKQKSSVSVFCASFEDFDHPLIDFCCSGANSYQMAAIYSSSDVYLNASIFEGSPLTPLEAMACGCVPITTPIGADEYIVDGVNGFLIDGPNKPQQMAERALSVISDFKLKQRLVKNGLNTVRQRPWNKTAERFEEILLSMDDVDVTS